MPEQMDESGSFAVLFFFLVEFSNRQKFKHLFKCFVKVDPDLWSCGGVPVNLAVGFDTKLFTSNHVLVTWTAVKEKCRNLPGWD